MNSEHKNVEQKSGLKNKCREALLVSVTRRALLAGIGTVSLPKPWLVGAMAFASPQSPLSRIFVDDPVATQGGELTFTIWRQLFYAGPAVVAYELFIADHLLSDTHVLAHPTREGVIEFGHDELFKFVRIPTRQNSGTLPASASIRIRALSGCKIAKNIGEGTINPGIVYYFAENGSEFALGTSSDKPLDYQSFPSLLKKCGPGTSFLFRRGDIFNNDGRLKFDGISGGTEERPVIIAAYGTGANPVIKTESSKSAWWFKGTHIPNEESRHLVISDLEFLRTARDAKLAAHLSFGDKSLIRPHDITVTRCQFFSNGRVRGALKSSSPKHDKRFGWLRNIEICFNSFDGATTYEISCAFDRFAIYSNTFKNGGRRKIRDWAIYASHARNGRIDDNFFENWIQGIKLRANVNLSANRNLITGHERVGISIGGDLSKHDGTPGIARRLVVDSNLIVGGLAILVMEQDNKPETVNPFHMSGLKCINNVILLPKSNRLQFGLGVRHHSAKNVTFLHNTIFRYGTAPAIRLVARNPLDNLNFENNLILEMPGSDVRKTISSKKSKWFKVDKFLAANLVYQPSSTSPQFTALNTNESTNRLHRHLYPDWHIVSKLIRATSRYTHPLTERDFWSNPRNVTSFFGAIESQKNRTKP